MASRSTQTWGRIGGLTAWARNDPETRVGPAHRGFRRRFEKLVDPDGTLDPAERAVRADRARRAHMLTLAAKSAKVRRAKKVGPRCARCGDLLTGGVPFVELDGAYPHSDECKSPAERDAELRAMEEGAFDDGDPV